ncbi:MAG TPA: pitrilysin family protein [Solirubrobacterales bacterium]|nr:pitrilysin family protein [Solirubrobacterales bacterium]
MPQEHTLTQLDSGIRVVTERVPSVRSIALGLWVRVGSRDEQQEQAGISHFLEHMLFKGTEELTAEQIAQEFDGLGADINAATSKEATVLHAHFLDEHLDRAFQVMGDMLLRSTWSDLESEREVVLEEIAMYEDEPQDKVHDVLSTAVFGDHPLGRPVIGRGEVISGLTAETVSAYHHARYLPGAIVVAAAGNLEHQQIEQLAERFVNGSRNGGLQLPEAAPPRREARAVFHQKETEQYHICIGGEGIARNDDRRFALSILDAILGGSTSSRLFQEVREKRGLAYAVYSWASQYQDTGQVGIYVGTREDNVVQALDVIGREMARIRDQQVGDDELRRAREHVKGRLALSMESTGARMNRLGRSVLMGTPLLTLDQTIERLEGVTREDLERLAGELYPAAGMSVAAIGRDEDLFRSALAPVSAELAPA